MIGDGLATDWHSISNGLATDWQRSGEGLAELADIKILSLAWHLVGHGLPRSSLAETSRIRIVLVPSVIYEVSVWVDPRLAWIGIGLTY